MAPARSRRPSFSLPCPSVFSRCTEWIPQACGRSMGWPATECPPPQGTGAGQVSLSSEEFIPNQVAVPVHSPVHSQPWAWYWRKQGDGQFWVLSALATAVAGFLTLPGADQSCSSIPTQASWEQSSKPRSGAPAHMEALSPSLFGTHSLQPKLFSEGGMVSAGW